MNSVAALALGVAAVALAACASAPTGAGSSAPQARTAPVAEPYGPVERVKSRDGKFDGEVVGTIAPESKFAELKMGMRLVEVQSLIGAPSVQTSHETGKRWIPFYFGTDARRLQVLYRGEGCLTYTGGNAWGASDNELIRITATLREDCME